MAIKMQLDPNTKYRVKDWDTNKVLGTFEKAGAAKKFCRDQGYIERRFTGKMPVAWVEADYLDHTGTPVACCYYNPRFN